MKFSGWMLSVAGAALALGQMAGAQTVSSPGPGWMAGTWCQQDADELVEEFWFAPRGGEMQGLSRTTKGEKTVSFEFARIATMDGVLAYIVQPGGKPPTIFKRSMGGDDWLRFENAAHDFPNRIEYRRVGEELHAEISGPGEGGEIMRIGFKYQACKP